MLTSFGSNFTQRIYTWSQWKTVYTIKGLPFQYEDDNNVYTIWSYDQSEVFMCQIWKNSIPDSAQITQSQNDLDKTDFETNFKSSGNLSLGQIDIDGAQIVRIKAAKKGWSFWAVPIEFTTSTLGASVYCKDSNLSDIPGITAKVYNDANVEITTAGPLNVNLSTITKTVIDFEPPFDYEIIGGALRINENPAVDARLWIVGAPDIPAQYGGSKEFASGINLKFLAPDSSFDIDGRVAKFLTYNPTTHQGKMRMIIRHPAGTSINIQITIHIYRM